MELDSRLFGERAKLSYFAVTELMLVQFYEAVSAIRFYLFATKQAVKWITVSYERSELAKQS